ncbi:MAG: acetylxylan esterase [Verrucomicrobia bacterium]|nr:acetylxylan esterase [Verrucomicrobiota bacterium]MBU4285564.1 acetylxylan esterase [Verrucomicrobiota bacterium]MBU4366346.1 acetylxylan esterase [Verrucomicrobiota bacterium]
MPFVDLPLAKLKRYRGRNPKPTDFERYCRRGIIETPHRMYCFRRGVCWRLISWLWR